MQRIPFIFLHNSQMLNVCTFGYMADVYMIIRFIPHTCQHITVDQRPEPHHSSYCCFLAANHGSSACGLSLKNTWRVYLSIGIRIIMTCYIVCLLQILQMFHGLMNFPVYMMYKWPFLFFNFDAYSSHRNFPKCDLNHFPYSCILHFHRRDELYVALAYVPEYVHRESMSLFNTAMKPVLYELICVRFRRKWLLQ
jgi:hypothetical protein